jgi:hypothetical protein
MEESKYNITDIKSRSEDSGYIFAPYIVRADYFKTIEELESEYLLDKRKEKLKKILSKK